MSDSNRFTGGGDRGGQRKPSGPDPQQDNGSARTMASAYPQKGEPAPADKPGMRTYDNSQAHFRLQYPADWTPQDDKD